MWHQRYRQQALWTAEIRKHLFKKAGLQPGNSVLEVGVGTGAILNAVAAEYSIIPFGLDINLPSLNYAKEITSDINLIQGDGNLLPLPANRFDLTFCHYLLLWVRNPGQILREMQRVTQPGGAVIALAEPDHDSRIDYPPPLDQLGQFQTQALRDQGADVSLGRRLRALFNEAGFADVEAGILGAQWSGGTSQPDKTEWMMLQADLQNRLSEGELTNFYEVDQRAFQNGKRVLFIPTFYALGQVV